MSVDLSTSIPIAAMRPRIDARVFERPDKRSGVGEAASTVSDSGGRGVNNVVDLSEGKAESIERKIIADLERRDRVVRAHEFAHIAVAGRFAAGGATFTLERGPDGRFFAVGGHVNLDVSEESTPDKTVEKMRVIRKAALAPVNPSSQDRSVAAEAASKEVEARRDMANEQTESLNGLSESEGKRMEGGVGGVSPYVAEGNFIDALV